MSRLISCDSERGLDQEKVAYSICFDGVGYLLLRCKGESHRKGTLEPCKSRTWVECLKCGVELCFSCNFQFTYVPFLYNTKNIITLYYFIFYVYTQYSPLRLNELNPYVRGLIRYGLIFPAVRLIFLGLVLYC